MPGATKVFREVDYASPRRGALDFIRYYRSDDFSYPSGYQGNLWAGLGVGWTHNYAGNLWVTSNSIWVRWRADAPQFFYPASSTSYPIELTAFRGDQQGRLVQLSANSYAYYTPTNLLVIFGEGWPAAVYDPSGWGVTLEYRAPGVSNIIEVSGRQLQIYYEDQAAHLTRVTDPAGKDIVYSYRPGPAGPDNIPATYSYTSLVGVTYEDHSSKQYVVGDWTPTSQILATKIMGVIDENGALYETVHYDAQGIAQSSELAGGVDKFVVSGTQVTDPLLTQRSYQFSQSAAAPSSVYQPAGSGCGASSSYKTYNADNTLLSEDDFDQHRICYAYDSKYREATRVEGLSTGVSCSSVLPSGSALPAGSRKTSTQWHPDWRLPSKVAEPGKITTDVYNNQPDPFKGGAVASCAPSSALLPDGKPIVVLCKRVEQATTDANGSQGFNAAMDTKVANRVWSYTYNQYGQVLTAKGPRTDVNDTTTYAYYPDTTSTHTLGDLQSVTDALGHTTNFTQYDPYGNVLEQVDVNQVVTDYTYDLRQRLKTVKVGSQSTSFDYWPTGLLKQVTWPDLSYVAYSYDDAHRLTDVSDSAGNSVHYVLDNAGNRTAEQYKDPSGTLKSELDRVYDALGRVQQTNGRE